LRLEERKDMEERLARTEETWKMTLEVVQDELKEVNGQLKLLKKQKTAQEEESKRQIAEMSTENYLNSQKADEAVAELAKLRTELSSREADFNALIEEKRLQVKELEGKLLAVHKSQEAADRLKADLAIAVKSKQSSEGELEAQRGLYKALEGELNSTKGTLNAKLSENEHLKLDVQSSAEKIKGLQETELEIASDLAQKKLQLDLLRKEKEEERLHSEASLAQRLRRITELETALQDSDDSASKLRAELAVADSSARDLRLQIEELQLMANEAKARHSESEALKRETEERLQQAQSTLQDARQKAEDLEHHNSALETELNALRDSSQLGDTLKNKYAHLQGKYKELLGAEASYKQRIAELDKAQTELRVTLGLKSEEISKLEHKALEEASAAKELKYKLHSVEREQERSAEEQGKLKLKAKRLKGELLDLQKEHEAAKVTYATASLKLTAELESAVLKATDAKAQAKEREASLKERKSGLERELEELRQTDRAQRLKADMQTQRITELETFARSKGSEDDSQVTLLLAASKEHQQEMLVKATEVQRVTTQLEIANKRIEKLEHKLQEQTDQANKLEAKKDDVQTVVLIEQISELKEQLRQSKDLASTQAALQVDILKNSLNEERDRVSHLTQQIQTMKNKGQAEPKHEGHELYSTTMQGVLTPDSERSTKGDKIQPPQAGSCGCELF
jgi:chromosome segregation ATPase